MTRASRFALLLVALCGCAGPAAESDGDVDAFRLDAYASDGGRSDGGSVEAGARDAGLDGGASSDAGTDAPVDHDAGGHDAGGRDASLATFVPGETMPYYEVTAGLDGAHNVGNLPGVALVPYPGRCDGGTMQLPAGTYTNQDFGNCVLDIRGNVTMNNCRGVLTHNYDTSIGSHLRILNGTASAVVLNDCEFHNRSQRLVDGLQGRNFVVNRSVFTGYVDGVDNAATGGAPSVNGGAIHDSWIGDHAWWRAATGGVVHTTDTQTHNDGSQVTTDLGITFTNTFFGAWASEYVGTGTPGSGSETNPLTAAYIVDQATMDSWRTTYLNQMTRPDQSWGGVAHRLSTGGSWAAVMANASNGTVDHCWFSGGTVSINLLTASVASGSWSIHRSVFWNDMSGGRALTSTTKGVAIDVRAGHTYDIPVTGPNANHWFDGTIVMPTITP